MIKNLAKLLFIALAILSGLEGSEARNPRGVAFNSVFGYDGVISVSASGVLVNGHNNAIMLRGGNAAGLQDQNIVNGNLYSVESVWGNQGGSGGGPDWPFLASQKLNAIRIPINAQSFQNTQSQTLVWGGSLGASSWAGTNIPGDPSGNYKNVVLQTIRMARAHGVYPLIELHECAPQFTFGASTQYLTAIDQPMFIDGQNGYSLWTSSNPTLGLPAWLATMFGSAAFNAANGFNGGAAGTYYNAAYGGASGLNDIIFELFNEPYFSNIGEVVLTTAAGTFGNPAWKAHNGGSNYTVTDGSTPPTTPGSSWTAGAEFVMLFGGHASVFFQQGTYLSGPPALGIASNFNDGSRANSLAMSWPVAGYQQIVTAIRGLGFTNVIGVNGSGFSSALKTLPYYLPVDTLSTPQLVVDNHAYPNCSKPAASGCQPATLDSTSIFTTWGQINAGTLTALPNPMPVLVTETGDEGGTGFTEYYIPLMTGNVDAATKGGVGIFPWHLIDQFAVGHANAVWQMNICNTNYTFTGTISNGSGGAGTILTVTGALTGTINPGDVLTSGLSNNTVDNGTYIDVYGANGTTGTGGLGTYAVVNAIGGNMSYTSRSFTACPVIEWSGQGQAFYDWARTHAN
jgi:Cellulase (glycosyl hydrolase family 5)